MTTPADDRLKESAVIIGMRDAEHMDLRSWLIGHALASLGPTTFATTAEQAAGMAVARADAILVLLARERLEASGSKEGS